MQALNLNGNPWMDITPSEHASYSVAPSLEALSDCISNANQFAFDSDPDLFVNDLTEFDLPTKKYGRDTNAYRSFREGDAS